MNIQTFKNSKYRHVDLYIAPYVQLSHRSMRVSIGTVRAADDKTYIHSEVEPKVEDYISYVGNFLYESIIQHLKNVIIVPSCNKRKFVRININVVGIFNNRACMDYVTRKLDTTFSSCEPKNLVDFFKSVQKGTVTNLLTPITNIAVKCIFHNIQPKKNERALPQPNAIISQVLDLDDVRSGLFLICNTQKRFDRAMLYFTNDVELLGCLEQTGQRLISKTSKSVPDGLNVLDIVHIMRKQMETMYSEIDVLNGYIQTLNGKVETLNGKVGGLTNQVETLTGEVNILKSQNGNSEEFVLLKNQIKLLQQENVDIKKQHSADMNIVKNELTIQKRTISKMQEDSIKQQEEINKLNDLLNEYEKAFEDLSQKYKKQHNIQIVEPTTQHIEQQIEYADGLPKPVKEVMENNESILTKLRNNPNKKKDR